MLLRFEQQKSGDQEGCLGIRWFGSHLAGNSVNTEGLGWIASSGVWSRMGLGWDTDNLQDPFFHSEASPLAPVPHLSYRLGPQGPPWILEFIFKAFFCSLFIPGPGKPTVTHPRDDWTRDQLGCKCRELCPSVLQVQVKIRKCTRNNTKCLRSDREGTGWVSLPGSLLSVTWTELLLTTIPHASTGTQGQMAQ